ncbi:unnamed protein product [Brassica oleracea var. botrytis]
MIGVRLYLCAILLRMKNNFRLCLCWLEAALINGYNLPTKCSHDFQFNSGFICLIGLQI